MKNKYVKHAHISAVLFRKVLKLFCADIPARTAGGLTGLTSIVAGNPVEDYGSSYRAPSFSGDAESCVVLTGVIGAHQPEGIQIDRFRPAVPGWYRVRFSAWSLRWERTHAVAAVRGMTRSYTSLGLPFIKDAKDHWQATPLPPERLTPKETINYECMENVEFFGTGEVTHIIRASLKGEPLGYFDAPSLKPTTHEFKVWLNPGERVSFHAMTLPGSAAPGGGFSDGVLDYDGPGVALVSFDVIGGWRDRYRLAGSSQKEEPSVLIVSATAVGYPHPPRPALARRGSRGERAFPHQVNHHRHEITFPHRPPRLSVCAPVFSAGRRAEG